MRSEQCGPDWPGASSEQTLGLRCRRASLPSKVPWPKLTAVPPTYLRPLQRSKVQHRNAEGLAHSRAAAPCRAEGQNSSVWWEACRDLRRRQKFPEHWRWLSSPVRYGIHSCLHACAANKPGSARCWGCSEEGRHCLMLGSWSPGRARASKYRPQIVHALKE